MNPVNFQGMNMAQMGMQMGQPQMGMTQGQMGATHMGQPQMGHPQMVQAQGHPMGQPQMANPTGQQQQILQYLRGQKTPLGWQQTYRIDLRLSFIVQIITQLNLLRAEATMQPVTIAIEFERKQFEISPDQMAYEGKCREKLQQLTDARQGKQRPSQNQNLQNPQMSFGQPQMTGNTMFTPQQQFQQPQSFSQIPQPMQAQQIALQQQQQQQQQQAQMQMRAGMGGQATFVNGQSGPNPPPPAVQGNNFQFTQQDQQQIQQIAQNMVNNMTPQDRITLQQTILNIQPQLRQSLTERGTNLSHYVIKQKATQAFLQQRARAAAQTGIQGAFPNGGVAAQQGQNAQVPTSAQVLQTPQFDQPSNMDHIVRQQQDALHHQQEGQMVVPANTGQRTGNPQRAPSRVQKTPQQPQQAAFGANRTMQGPSKTPQQPQPTWNPAQKQTPNLQHQTPQVSQAPNFAKMQAQTPQPNPLQGQTGGLSNARRTPQQNTRMPTLNQPMKPPNQSQNVSSPNPVQQIPNQGQRNAQNAPNGQQRSMPNGQQNPMPAANIPPKAPMPIAMQQHIASLKTDEEKRNFVMMMRQRQQLQRQHAANNNMIAQANQGRGQPQQSGPQKQSIPNQGIPSGGLQQNLMQNSQASMGRPAQNAQQPDLQNPLRPTQSALTEAQEQQMDSVSYPDNILNSHSVLARMPGHVKNWGQLKQWVAANAQHLPPDSLQKLKTLQARHYQMGLQDPRRSMINQGQPPSITQQPPGPGPAPAAPMFVTGNIQQPGVQGQTPAQVSQIPFSQIPPPTMQEVQSFKANLPNSGIMSEEQIQRTIMNQKRQDLLNAQQNSQNGAVKNQQQIMQERYAAMIRNHQLQQTRSQGLPAGQMQQQQAPDQTPGSTNGTQWAAQQARMQQTAKARQKQANQAGPKPQQGVKRSNNDDVIEVPDPKLGQLQNRQAPATAEAGQARPNVEQSAANNRLNPAQIGALTPAQRAAYENQRRSMMAQNQQRELNSTQQTGLPAQLQGQSNAAGHGQASDPKSIRLKSLRDDVIRTMPPRQAVNVSPMERGNMVKKLLEVKGLFNRIDQSLPVYLVATQNEARIKDVIRTQLLLAAQVRDSDHNPVDNFTITPDEFRNHLNNLQRYMTEVSHFVQQMQQKANQVKQTQQSHGAKPAAQAAAHTQQLSAANLQQQQEAITRTRTASLNKTQGASKTPAAPTTSHVPFPFGSQSPQGVPQIYVPKKNELTQDKLQLPVSKKQKKNLANGAGATPATARSPTKLESPEAQRLPTPILSKCSAPDCSHPAFASKELLDKHVRDVHQVKDEQIIDPLEYVLGGLRIALDLDEKGRPKHVEANPVSLTDSAPNMKISASSHGHNSIKQEVATPTSKNVAGPKASQNKTSTPTSGRGNSQASPPDTVQGSWASSNISPLWFTEVFRNVADPNSNLSNDFLGTWLEAQPHPDISSSDDSPNSTDKNSPHKSDISATDNLDIKVVGEDGFLSENWFDVTGDMETLDMASFLNIDLDLNSVAEPTGNLSKKQANAGETSDEWLKVYAPAKYDEKMKTEKKATR